MNDLIRRQDAIDVVAKEYQYESDRITALQKVPVVEAVPVVHGEWIDTQPDYHAGYGRNAHVCSNCNDYYTTEPEDLFFCPRCGADMRKDDK